MDVIMIIEVLDRGSKILPMLESGADVGYLRDQLLHS